MKLLRLKLNTPFRSLHAGFEVNFLRRFDTGKTPELAPYALVGPNGSGKSNILEALAAIFYHIECIYLDYKPDFFSTEIKEVEGASQIPEWNEQTCNPDAFEVEYLIPVERNGKQEIAHILITKKEGEQPLIKWLNNKNSGKEQEIILSRIQVKEILPQYVVAYSSGENEILSLPFFKMRFIQYDEYQDRLIRDFDYIRPESRLIYLDHYFNQAILLSIYLLRDEKQTAPFRKAIQLEGIQSFQLIISQKHRINVHDDILRMLSPSEREMDEKITRELTEKIHKGIKKLIKCSTCQYFDKEKEEWYLDYYIDEKVKNEKGEFEDGPLVRAFKLYFGDAFELFNLLQILLNLNYYKTTPETKEKIYRSNNIYLNQDVIYIPNEEERILRFKNMVLRKENTKDIVYTRSLSDGEYQLIHTLGLSILFSETNSLFLLDEPETHFNPGWRSAFISTLRECFKESTEAGRHTQEILITSHSPFIISDSREENVLIFDKDHDTGKVSVKRPDFKTFGASINQITMKVFNKRETIGGYAETVLQDFYDRLDKKEDSRVLIDEINRTMGDSVEKIMFVNAALDKLKK